MYYIRAYATCGFGRRTMATVEAESNLKKLKLAPEYIAHREELWKKYKERHLAELEVNAKQNKPITITLPDGSSKDGVAFVTTPYDVAKMISQGLANAAVIAKVNGILWDLERPLESDVSSFELKKFDDHEGQQVFWHSSAHILGEAMENFYGGCLCYGPPIESGFFYDMHIPDRFVSSNEFAELTGMAKAVISEKQPFERLVLSKAELLELFDYNLFKKRIINERIVEDRTTVYKCGTLIDLCRGPHVRHTGCVKAIKIIKNSSTYWQGDAEAESLQRVYGISFPDNKQLKDWEKFQEEAAKRDHRKLGRDQELFFFHELSPGCGFFQPHGAHIYNTLVDFMKSEYRKRGFKEVITPNMFNANLWKISGHWDHYAENMFSFESEKQKFALKPMNCPGHCLIFAHRPRSWRELPLRMADFGVLHRNELSGALSGLTRVRRFCQDDAHIFCAPEQVQSEIEGCLDFLFYIYDTFGFTCKLFLSTRPKDFLGEISEWDAAEKQLSSALDAHCKKLNTSWTLNPEDGAFYGPKIDITIQDALRRNHQCATIQLDFQLPRRFNLEYNPKEGDSARPVIIHRAILGSMERMMAVLTENYGGKWPFWLSPRQVIVVPVGRPFNDYAQQVHKQLWEAGFQSECDLDDGDTMQKKIRNAQIAQFNFILVVGQKEQSSETVNIRTRTNVVLGELSVEDFISKLQHCKSARLKDTDEVFGKEK